MADFFKFTGGMPLANGRLSRGLFGYFIGDTYHLWKLNGQKFEAPAVETLNADLKDYDPWYNATHLFLPNISELKKVDKIVTTGFDYDPYNYFYVITSTNGEVDTWMTDDVYKAEAFFLLGNNPVILECGESEIEYGDGVFAKLPSGLNPVYMNTLDIETGSVTREQVLYYSGFNWTYVSSMTYTAYYRCENGSYFHYDIGGHQFKLVYPYGTSFEENGKFMFYTEGFTGGTRTFNCEFQHIFKSLRCFLRTYTYTAKLSYWYVYPDEQSTGTIPPHQWQYADGNGTKAGTVEIYYFVDDGSGETIRVDLEDGGEETYRYDSGYSGYVGDLYEAGTETIKGLIDYTHGIFYLDDEPVSKPTIKAVNYINRVYEYYYTRLTATGLRFNDRSTGVEKGTLNTSTGALNLNFDIPYYEQPNIKHNIWIDYPPYFEAYFDDVEIDTQYAKDILVANMRYTQWGLRYEYTTGEGQILYSSNGGAFYFCDDQDNWEISVWSIHGKVTYSSSNLLKLFFLNDLFFILRADKAVIFSIDENKWTEILFDGGFAFDSYWPYGNYDGKFYYFYDDSSFVRINKALTNAETMEGIAGVERIMGGLGGKFLVEDTLGNYKLMDTDGSKHSVEKPEGDDITGIFGTVTGF